MPTAELKSLLQRLRDHLPEGEASTQQKQLMDQITYHLHDSDTPDLANPSLKNSVELLVEQVEAEHPKTAAVARSILETLSSIGI